MAANSQSSDEEKAKVYHNEFSEPSSTSSDEAVQENLDQAMATTENGSMGITCVDCADTEEDHFISDLFSLDLFASEDDDAADIDIEDEGQHKHGSNLATHTVHFPKTVPAAKTKLDHKNDADNASDNVCTSHILLCDKLSDAQHPNMDGQSTSVNTTKTARPTEEEDFCAICRDSHVKPKVLHKCSHSFCTDCIDTYFQIKPQCPECFTPYGVITGNMPEGSMVHWTSDKTKLEGYPGVKTIVICYSFKNGTQTDEHPNPGKTYYGTERTAYLPDTPEGNKVLRLLKASFDRKLTFTVGRSRTTGMDNQVTWNDIHHKTCTYGGQQNFGYPDPTYLQRVQEELAAKGVTIESLEQGK